MDTGIKKEERESPFESGSGIANQNIVAVHASVQKGSLGGGTGRLDDTVASDKKEGRDRTRRGPHTEIKLTIPECQPSISSALSETSSLGSSAGWFTFLPTP
jgi:hypothetical protein